MLDIKTSHALVSFVPVKLNTAAIAEFVAGTLEEGDFVVPTGTVGEWAAAGAGAAGAKPLFVQNDNYTTTQYGQATVLFGRCKLVTDKYDTGGTYSPGDLLKVNASHELVEIGVGEEALAVGRVIIEDTTTTPDQLHYELF